MSRHTIRVTHRMRTVQTSARVGPSRTMMITATKRGAWILAMMMAKMKVKISLKVKQSLLRKRRYHYWPSRVTTDIHYRIRTMMEAISVI